MLIDSSHRKWIVGTAVLFIASTVGYVSYARTSLNPPTGASWPGLAYGIAGTAILFFAGAFGLRRKVPTWRIGRAQTWLRAHIWLGLLSYPLIFFHAGFQIGGALTWALMILFTLVILSGIFGVVAQQLLPQSMTTHVPLETIYEEIDHVLAQLVEEADKSVEAVAGPLQPEPVAVAAGEAGGEAKPRRRGKQVQPLEGSGDLKEFYLDRIRPFLEGTMGAADPLLITAERSAIFEQLRIGLPPPLHRTVVHLEEVCEERRQLLHQRWLHYWLHGWIFVHLPLSVALLLLTVVHAVMALKY